MLSSLVETLDTPEVEARGRDASGISCNSEAAFVLSGAAGALFRSWSAYIHESLWYYYHTVYESPTFISCTALEAAGHVEHFPQHGLAPKSVMEMCAAYLSPAVCLHTYPMFAKMRLDDEGSAVMVSGPCAPYECGKWDPPLRFHMIEMVAVGTPDYVSVTRDAVAGEIARRFAKVGLEGDFHDTDDESYFGMSGGSPPARKLNGPKREFRVSFGAGSVALAAVSGHEDYFGRRFGIEDVNGQPAYSFCAAFSIERLTALGLTTWGSSMSGWPERLRSYTGSTPSVDPPGPF